MKESNTFKNEFIETKTLGLKDKMDYQENIKKILSQQLGPLNRVIYGLISLISLVAFLYFGSWVLNSNSCAGELGNLILIVCSIGMIFSGILVFFTGWSAVTGKVKGRFYPGFIFSSTVIVFCYFWITLFYLFFILPVVVELSSEGGADWRPILGVQLMLLGFFAMVAVGFIFLFRSMSDLKFNNQKKLLQIEYKLSELIQKAEDN